MLTEDLVAKDSDDVVLVILVVVVQVLEYLELHTSLVLELLLILDDLDGHHLVGPVVKALQCLAKTSRTK